jgi:hypothetical protein
MRIRLLVTIVSVCFASSIAIFAQSGSGLVGTWERISLRGAEGQTTQPPAPAAFVVFTANGQWSQMAIPSGRPKVDKPVQGLTKEELVARFDRVEARRGTYNVAGTTLTRKNVVSGNPNQEGTDSVQSFRIEGDVLILSSTDPKLKNEARFRRVK